MQSTVMTLCKERHLQTYAVQRIRGAMLDELRSRDWVPRSVRRNAREVAHAMGQLEQELGRNATETEVAERSGHSC